MEKYSKKQYAEYLQDKFEKYFKDFSIRTGKTKEEIILKYCKENCTKEDMYNIDIMLNFLADYGSYYLHELDLLEENNDFENLEEIKRQIEEIDKEYDILEKLIYNTGENYISEKQQGKIENITQEELEKVFKEERVCTPKEIQEISNWVRYSYYIFLENYRNKMTTIKAGKESYNFEMSEENLCHLLGIKKDKIKAPLPPNTTMSQVLKMIINEGETIKGQSPLERITELQKNTPIFNYQMIKYKNYLFQNFGLLSNASAIHINVKPQANNKWLSTTFLLSRLLKKIDKNNYSEIGFFNDNNIRYIPETIQSTNCITKGIGEVYNIKSIFKKAKGTVKNIREEKKTISKMELCCIFSAKEQLKMIEDILGEGEDKLSKNNITELKTYYYRIYSSIDRFTKTREILKEKSREQEIGGRKR